MSNQHTWPWKVARSAPCISWYDERGYPTKDLRKRAFTIIIYSGDDYDIWIQFDGRNVHTISEFTNESTVYALGGIHEKRT